MCRSNFLCSQVTLDLECLPPFVFLFEIIRFEEFLCNAQFELHVHCISSFVNLRYLLMSFLNYHTHIHV